MGLSTNYLICYDITEDDIRTSIAESCTSAGLIRIQYSVFYGSLEKSHLSSLKIRFQSIIEGSNANIHIIKVCQSCEKDHQVLTSLTIDGIDQTTEELYEDISEELDTYSGYMIL